MSDKAPASFSSPWLILCEGRGDEHFLRLLLAHHHIEDFQVISPQRELGGGRQAFGRYLGSVGTNEDFLTKVQGVLVITDHDDANAFAETQIELAKANVAVPITPGQVAKGAPPIAIYLWPEGAEGNLESLCLDAAYSQWPIKEPLDAFVAQTPAAGWTIGKQAKMRMQTILAAHNDKAPDTGFSASWSKKPQYQVPIAHPDFNPVADFIKSFPGLVAAA